MRNLSRVIALSALALFFAVAAFCQGATGTIHGTVSDAGGGAGGGASVTATNAGTGAQSKTTTGATGSYSLVELPPGMYTVSVEAAGFRRATTSEQRLIVASNLHVDVALEVGVVTESVTVDT